MYGNISCLAELAVPNGQYAVEEVHIVATKM
jgi:hypothetical protein